MRHGAPGLAPSPRLRPGRVERSCEFLATGGTAPGKTASRDLTRSSGCSSPIGLGLDMAVVAFASTFMLLVEPISKSCSLPVGLISDCYVTHPAYFVAGCWLDCFIAALSAFSLVAYAIALVCRIKGKSYTVHIAQFGAAILLTGALLSAIAGPIMAFSR